MKATIHDVADFFLNRFQEDEGSSVTHLKLQKLCYYAQAWHLAFYGKPLIDDEFEAWVHGPVNTELYDKYRDKSYQCIEPVDDFNRERFTRKQLDLLEEVWDIYGGYDGRYLEQLTHQEEPWREARRGYSPGQRCTEAIDNGTMERYYKSL